MHKMIEIAQLLERGMSQRQIASSLHVSRRTIKRVEETLSSSKLSVQSLQGMSEKELQGIFPNQKEGMDEIYYKPDFDSLVKELRKPGVNLQLLWEEYVAEALHNGKVPYQITQFKHYFNLHLNKITFTDIMHHKPGDQVEVDWAGTKVKYFDADTGIEVSGYLFVGCLPFSQYIYAEAFEDMKAAAFLTAHIHMFEYFGGVPKIIVCDNLKTGVLKHGANEDIILNPSYQNLAEHYGCVILPARVKKPKDKPSAEKSVDIATTWLIGKMRNMQCFSIAEYNESLFQNLEKINQKKFSKKPGSRSESFHTIEQEYLNPLPCNPFELCTWKVAKVQSNSHIALERKYYSVPYQWIGKEVSLKITDDFIRIYANNQLLCEHSHLKGRDGAMSTQAIHMPPNSNSYGEWNSDRYKKWAKHIGPNSLQVIERLFDFYKIEQQGYNGARSILKLADTYSDQRLEAACKLALENITVPRYKNIKSILENNQDKVWKENEELAKSEQGAHLRGAQYYKTTGNDYE